MNEIVLRLPKVPMRGRLLMKGRTWRAQWGKNKREKGDWRLLIRSAIRGQRPRRPLSGVVIETTIYRRKGFDLDDDNRLFSIKPLVDALVDEGVIRGDTSRHATLKVPRQVRCVGTPGLDEQTVVRIRRRG